MEFDPGADLRTDLIEDRRLGRAIRNLCDFHANNPVQRGGCYDVRPFGESQVT